MSQVHKQLILLSLVTIMHTLFVHKTVVLACIFTFWPMPPPPPSPRSFPTPPSFGVLCHTAAHSLPLCPACEKLSLAPSSSSILQAHQIPDLFPIQRQTLPPPIAPRAAYPRTSPLFVHYSPSSTPLCLSASISLSTSNPFSTSSRIVGA